MVRLARLRESMAEHGWPAVLITEPRDIAWLSGFRGSSGALLVTETHNLIITDFRYRTQVGQEAPGWTPFLQETGERLPAAMARAIDALVLPRICAQSTHLTHAVWSRLTETLGSGVDLVPVADMVGPLRAIKDAGELSRMRAAAALADAVVAYAWTVARPGLSEAELRVELETYMLRQGTERVAFDLIVAAGPNSAKCHARPGQRIMATGDLLLIDLGCVVDGYHSDITRTVALGSASDEQRALYTTVHQALTAGMAAVRPGAVGRAVDAVARDLIGAAGHGANFGHSLGHGVGLQVHEGPNLGPTSEDVLKPGHVVTVEPGIYVEGLGGIRLEQLCLVTETGCEALSLAPCPEQLPVI